MTTWYLHLDSDLVAHEFNDERLGILYVFKAVTLDHALERAHKLCNPLGYNGAVSLYNDADTRHPVFSGLTRDLKAKLNTRLRRHHPVPATPTSPYRSGFAAMKT